MTNTKRMSWIAMAIAGALLATTSGAAQKALSPDALYRRAVQKQEVDGDTQAAIDLYRQVVDAAGASPTLRAQAQERLTSLSALAARSPTERLFCSGDCAGYRLLASFSADGRYLATTNQNDALEIRDTMTGRVIRPGGGAKELTYGPWTLISPDGQEVVYNFAVRDPKTNAILRQTLQVVRAEDNAKPRTVVDNPEYRDFIAGAWRPSTNEVLVTVAKQDNTWLLAWVSLSDGQVHPIKSLGWRFSVGMSRASLSPDGRYIAYSALASAPKSRGTGGSDTHIYVLPVDLKSDEIELVSGASANFSPVWMADSRTVLFVSNRGGGQLGIYSASLKDPKGSPVLVKSGTGSIWSVGMRESSYYYLIDQPQPDQFVIVDSHGRPSADLKHDKSSPIMGLSPAWSPDGTRLAFQRRASEPFSSALRNSFLVYSPVSKSEQRYNPISAGADGASPGTVNGSSPAPLWMHDGKTLLQPIWSAGQLWFFRVDLSREDVAGVEVARIAVNRSDAAVALSSNDQAIYVLAPGRAPTSASATRTDRIVAIDVASGKSRDVATVPASTAMLLSPDDKSLYLKSGCNPQCDRIVAVDAASGEQAEVFKLQTPETLYNGRTALAASAPSTQTLAISADGKALAAIALTPSSPGHRSRLQLFRIAVDGSDRRNLADLGFPGNLSWAKDGTLFAASESGLVRIPPNGGTPEIIGTITSTDVSFSPDGAHLAVASSDSTLPTLRTIDNVPALLKAAR
jgi:Tol biopolymer transport system component